MKRTIYLIVGILCIFLCACDNSKTREDAIGEELRKVTPIDEDKVYRAKVSPFLYRRSLENSDQKMIGRLRSSAIQAEDREIALVVYLSEFSGSGIVDVQNITGDGPSKNIKEKRHKVEWSRNTDRTLSITAKGIDLSLVPITGRPENFVLQIKRLVDEPIPSDSELNMAYERIIDSGSVGELQ